MKSAAAIAFDLAASRSIALAAAAIVVAAIVAPWRSALPPALCGVVSIAAAALGFVSLRAFLDPRFRRLSYRSSGWVLVDRADREHAALLKAHRRLGSWVSLDFRLDRGERFRIALGPDNLDAETRRRLVLLLARAEVAHAA